MIPTFQPNDRRIVFLLVALLLFCVGFAVRHLTALQSDLTAATALENGKLYAEAIAAFRTLYTREVVEPLHDRGIPATHDYEQQEGAIPLPATLSMLLGKKIGETSSGAQTRLYSRYPFPWRQAENQRFFEDPFVRDAWEHWEQNPDSDEPFYRFEEFAGRFSLRYAIADRMRRSCLDCHNNHPDTPKNDWKVNEVRGVLETVTPLDSIRELSRSTLRDTFFVLAGLTGIGAIGLVLVTGRFRHSSRILEAEVQERKRAEDQLQSAHNELEVRVERRTLELNETNASLQAEIAERERAEKQLRTSEERFDLAVQGSNDGLWDWDISTDKEWWSPRFYGLLGYEVGEIEASYPSFQDLLHPEDKDRTLELVRAHLDDRAPYDIEHRLRCKSGEYRWFSARGQACWDALGRPLRMAGSIRDITNRKNAQEALRESESRLLLALEALDGGVWDWNVQTGEVHFTESWYRMLGYEPGEIEEHVRTWENALHPDDKPAVMKMLNAHFEGRSPYYSEHRMRTKSGGWIWVLDRGQVVERDKNGKPIRMTGTDVNITDRKLAEEEKRALEAQVLHAQKLESLGVLAGGIAHDFNNLLVGVIGNADLALTEMPAEAPARPFIQDVVTAAERAAQLTKQMLAYSGKGRFVVKPLDLSKLVHEMAHLLKVSISKKVALRYELADSLYPVEADAVQLQQVVMNLVTNAAEAVGDRNGVVSIRTGVMEVDRNYLSETYLNEGPAEGCYNYVEVADTGCGMDEATKRQIFDPFFTTKFTGRGLGLAAVMGIVKGHKGAIKVDSTAGEGSTFRVLFTRSEEALEAPQAKVPDVATWQGGGWILVIDDEESVSSFAKRLFERHGFSVVTANDGREALQVFKRRSNEITGVLLDLTMPGMDGEETFRELRRVRPDVKVILTSGYNEQEVTGRFAGKGLAGFAAKPFRPGKLIEVVRRVLGAPSAPAGGL